MDYHSYFGASALLRHTVGTDANPSRGVYVMVPNSDGAEDEEEYTAKYKGNETYWVEAAHHGAKGSSSNSNFSHRTSLSPAVEKPLEGVTKRQRFDTRSGSRSEAKGRTGKESSKLQGKASKEDDEGHDSAEEAIATHFRDTAGKLTLVLTVALAKNQKPRRRDSKKANQITTLPEGDGSSRSSDVSIEMTLTGSKKTFTGRRKPKG